MRLRSISWPEVPKLCLSDYSTYSILSFRASLISGFLSSFVSLPFDNAKTKIQKMKKDANGVFPYKNIFDAMQKTITNEGVSKLWVGFPTFYFRIAPHVCITLITQDLLTDWVKKLRNPKHWDYWCLFNSIIYLCSFLSNESDWQVNHYTFDCQK